MPVWAIATLVSLAISVAAYLLAPKPKQPKPDPAKEMDSPTADAGRPVPVVFGEITVKAPNVLYFGNKSIRSYKVKA